MGSIHTIRKACPLLRLPFLLFCLAAFGLTGAGCQSGAKAPIDSMIAGSGDGAGDSAADPAIVTQRTIETLSSFGNESILAALASAEGGNGQATKSLSIVGKRATLPCEAGLRYETSRGVGKASLELSKCSASSPIGFEVLDVEGQEAFRSFPNGGFFMDGLAGVKGRVSLPSECASTPSTCSSVHLSLDFWLDGVG